MTEKIRAVLAEPGKPARAVEIENSYESIRDTVGGPITTWRTGVPGTVCYVHDEALIEGLPWNRCHRPSKTYLAGNILAVADDGHGGERSLSATEETLTVEVLNNRMELMDASRASSLEELEELTGEPAVQFFSDDPAEAFEQVCAGLASATWEPLTHPPEQAGWTVCGARSRSVGGWAVVVVAFKPANPQKAGKGWSADGTVSRGPIVMRMTPAIADACAKAAGLTS